MFFRARRGDAGPDPTLSVRHTLLWLGLGLGLIGMSTGTDWLVWLAIAALAVGVGLGAWRRRQADRAGMDGAWPGEEGEEDPRDEV